MTRKDTLTCVHEPFGDAFYFGPERLSDRYEHDVAEREASGFANSTFKTIFERIERESQEVRTPYTLSAILLYVLLKLHTFESILDNVASWYHFKIYFTNVVPFSKS